MKAGLLRTQFSYQNTVVREKMKEKTKESVSAVVPIMLIVLLLGFTIAPLSPSILVEFIVGAVLVIIGMVFFRFTLHPFSASMFDNYDNISVWLVFRYSLGVTLYRSLNTRLNVL